MALNRCCRQLSAKTVELDRREDRGVPAARPDAQANRLCDALHNLGGRLAHRDGSLPTYLRVVCVHKEMSRGNDASSSH